MKNKLNTGLGSLALSAILVIFATCASPAAAGGYDSYTPPTGGVSNQSSNTNISQMNGQLGQDQSQVNDSHNTAIAAPQLGQGQEQNQLQQNLATGGALNVDSHDRVANKSYTTFGPPANAFRSGDCAGTADGFSLYTYLGGIGYSHAPESMPCRMQQQIQLTCGVANTLVQTGTVLAQNNQLNQTGFRILTRAIEALDQCIIQLKGAPLAVELAQNYGKTYGTAPITSQTLHRDDQRH